MVSLNDFLDTLREHLTWERKARRRAQNARAHKLYWKTAKGRATRRRYNISAKGKAVARRYREFSTRRETQRVWYRAYLARRRDHINARRRRRAALLRGASL